MGFTLVGQGKWPQHLSLWGKPGLGLRGFQGKDLKRIRTFKRFNSMEIGIFKAES